MIVFWILIFVIAIIGFIIGAILPFKVTAVIFPYISVVLIALVDSILYALYLIREHIVGGWRIIVRLIFETAYGCFMIFFGEQGGLDLYLVAVIPMGASIFYSLHKVMTGRSITDKL